MSPLHPIEQAHNLYRDDGRLMSEYYFDRTDIMRLPEGRVIETADCVLWGFPVRLHDGPPYAIRHEPQPDAWFVWLCTGSIARILDLIPYRLDHIIFARDNRHRAYNFDLLTKKLIKQRHAPQLHDQQLATT